MDLPDGFATLALPPSGFIEANGPLYGRRDGDRFVLGIRIEARHCNPAGTCHGGMLMLLADMLLAMGANVQAKLSRFLPTMHLDCDFLAPAPLGAWVEGRLDVLKVTRSTVFAQGLLTVEGAPILRASAVLKLPAEPNPAFAAERYFD